MIRAAAVLFLIVFGFVLNAAAQDFRLSGASGRAYFKNLKNGGVERSLFKVEFGVDGLRVRPTP